MKKIICCLATLAVAFGALSAVTFVKANAATTPAFKGVSVSLNENIVLKFEVENYTTGYTLTFNYKNKDYVGEVKSGVAEFAYVTPQYLDEVVTATIYDGETKVNETKKSVKEYLYELIRAKKADYSKMPCEQFAAMKTLAVDMLEYGAEAQKKYLSSAAEELVTAELTTEEAALATTFVAPDSSAQATLSGTKAGYDWVSAGIRFDYNVSLYFVVKPLTENAVLKLKINDNEVIDKFTKDENGNYKFRFENVNVVDFANKYTVKVLDEAGNAIGQTLSYSVNTYVLNMHANAETGEITKAVYNYGVSATKYNTAKGEHVYESTFTPPTRLVYASGEKLDTAGMSLVLTCPICGDKKDVTSEVALSMETAPAEDSGTHEVTATYGNLTETFKITLVKSETKRLSFNDSSISSSLTASTAENPLFVEPANTVKNYKKVDEIWTETTSKAYGVNDSGIVRIKANAVIKIHFYRETAAFGIIGVNAASYYLMEPAIGKTYPVEFKKLFSSVTLNGVKADIKNGILPGAENWTTTFVDADLCEGNLKAGDNVLELTVSDYYWMSKSSQSESDSNQLYGETDFTIKYIDILALDYVERGTATIVFDKKSINAELNEATADNPLFIEPANTVKNYKKENGIWTETTSNAYGVNDSNGIVGIKANAVIKIHFYRETTSYAKISMNAATYYPTLPAVGKISPMDLPKLFSSIKLNGKDVIVKNDTLPGGEKWISVPADVNLCEGELKTGDNVLELTVSDYYWMSGMNASDANYGKQLYNETFFSIKSLSFSLYDYIK